MKRVVLEIQPDWTCVVVRQLEDENAKLKKLLAEAMLDNAMLKEITAKKW